MKTELIKLNSMLLGGMNFYGDPISTKGGWDSENEIGKTWDRFMKYMSDHPERPSSCKKPYLYEIHICSSETATKGYFEVFVGEEVNATDLPIELCLKFIPTSNYIRITLYGQEITDDWRYKLDSEIIQGKGVRRVSSYIIQAYDERFKGMDNIDDSILDVYIPVELE